MHGCAVKRLVEFEWRKNASQPPGHHRFATTGCANQENIVAAAHRSGVAVLENQQLDTTVHRVTEVIFAAVDGVLPRRGLQPVRGDVAA